MQHQQAGIEVLLFSSGKTEIINPAVSSRNILKQKDLKKPSLFAAS